MSDQPALSFEESNIRSNRTVPWSTEKQICVIPSQSQIAVQLQTCATIRLMRWPHVRIAVPAWHKYATKRFCLRNL
jgi:hypothetical protein